ncbi:hypothetical protein, partial [Nocardioides sp.]|uniref:hypothetical protein n=1 Tax=Nocardioides sp. TaxID=35761 RepID=UPI00273527B4
NPHRGATSPNDLRSIIHLFEKRHNTWFDLVEMQESYFKMDDVIDPAETRALKPSQNTAKAEDRPQRPNPTGAAEASGLPVNQPNTSHQPRFFALASEQWNRITVCPEPRSGSTKRRTSHMSSSRTIRGVQRSPSTSTAFATGQNWPREHPRE